MSNSDKNTNAKQQITKALLTLLKKKPLDAITISSIAEKAGVSRMTIYRNYSDKADILRQHLKTLMMEINNEFLRSEDDSIENYLGKLFGHLKKNSDFYTTLFENDLGHLLLQYINDQAGPKPENSNISAYRRAFFSHGLYGWINEWAARGMTEEAEDITHILKESDQKWL